MIETIAEYKEIQQAETIEQYKLLQHIEQNFGPDTQLSITLMDDNTIECKDATGTMILQLCNDAIYELDDDEKILRGTI